MVGRRGWGQLIAAFLLCAAFASPAYATHVTATLTASSGLGTFDPSLPCSRGDGASSAYTYAGKSVGGPLSGGWSGAFEVHQAQNASIGWVPAHSSTVRLDLDRGGTADLDFSAGSCAAGTWPLSTVGDIGTRATGSAPFTVTAGSGTLRGLTGSGTLTATRLDLGPGADNVANVTVDGNLQALAPALVVGIATAYWNNVTDLLTGTVTVSIPIGDIGPPNTTGDGYAVTLTAASGNGRAATAGVPGVVGRLDVGHIQNVIVRIPGCIAGSSMNLATTVGGNDALDTAQPPKSQTQTVSIPLLSVL